jgi:type I restriction enzyme, S subunit
MRTGWVVKELEEVAKVYSGNSINAKEKAENYIGLEIGTPFIATKDVSFDHQVDYNNGVLIPEPKSSEFKIAPKNSVLVCAEGGSAGRKIAHNDRDINFGNKLFAIVPDATADSKFFFYYCINKDFYDAFSEKMVGIIGGVSLKKFKSLLFPIPPLPEQKRIVAILDETFDAIDKAVANAEKNLANARELFESYLSSTFAPSENLGQGEPRKDWITVKLKDICTKITDGVHKKPNYLKKGVPFIKINNLTCGSGISFEGVSYISKEDHELFCKRTNPEKGDILITKDGTIGIVRIVDTEIEFSIFVSVALVKPIDKSISPYLKYVLESPLIQNQINPQGAALKHLYLRDLREYSVPIPPKSEKNKIVVKLNALSVKAKRLESIYQHKLACLAELKQSLLQKAFSGELTSNDTAINEEAVA